MFPNLYRIMMLHLLDLEVDDVKTLTSADFYRLAESARSYVLKWDVGEPLIAEVKSAENPEAVALILTALSLSEQNPGNAWPWREALWHNGKRPVIDDIPF